MKRVLALVVLAAVGAVAIVLATSGGGIGVEQIAEAADKTQRAGSSKMSMRGEMEMPGAGEKVPFTAEGVIDASGRRGRMTIDMSKLAEVGGGTSGLTPDDMRGEQIIDGSVIYMRLGVFDPLLPRGKTWVKIDVEKVGGDFGLDFGTLTQPGVSSPHDMLDQLRAMSGDLEEIGSERVRGVETTGYRATVDLRRFPDTLPPEKRQKSRETIDQRIEKSGVSRFPTEVWVDREGLVRRLTQLYDMKPEGQSQRIRMKLTMDLFDFGTPVRVEPPPAREAIDFEDALRRAS